MDQQIQEMHKSKKKDSYTSNTKYRRGEKRGGIGQIPRLYTLNLSSITVSGYE